MAILLGVDTGGTYTDAVLIDDVADRVIASAKSLTTRPDLARGIAGAVDAVMVEGDVGAGEVAMVSLSTTLATNALVEGQGGRVALVFIGFDKAEIARAGLEEALGGDPVIVVGGGHSHAGDAVSPLDTEALEAGLARLPAGTTGIAVAAQFATRNPAHEQQARALIRERTGLPVTCSHELANSLGGPRRALTAVLNARLIGLIDGLITACRAELDQRGIAAELMVVRGDGALISADLARERPIETILSGPAASIAGAQWLTGESDALVSDIGGTTTDICLLRGGRPAIDPAGARVGRYRTMVEAVAMRTTGLGGDSEVHLRDGLDGGLFLGPRRVMPVSLLAQAHPRLVHRTLDEALSRGMSGEATGRFAVPLWSVLPEGLDRREAAVAERLSAGPLPVQEAVRNRIEGPALDRLVSRGAVILSALTPSDAGHVLGLLSGWDGLAAEKALRLFALRRTGAGNRIATDATAMAQMVVDQLTEQTVTCLLEAAFAEDDREWEVPPDQLARHAIVRAGLDGHRGVIETDLRLGVPVVGLGASAPSYYGAVGTRLGARMILPAHAGVANAIGAVVGQVSIHVEGLVSAAGAGQFVSHTREKPTRFIDRDEAIRATQEILLSEAAMQARAAGIGDMSGHTQIEIKEVEVDGSPMFIEARIRATMKGRPRIAEG